VNLEIQSLADYWHLSIATFIPQEWKINLLCFNLKGL